LLSFICIYGTIVGGVAEGVAVAEGVNVEDGVKVERGVRVGTRVGVVVAVRVGVNEGGKTRVGVISASAG
jgi:hypothetical protein